MQRSVHGWSRGSLRAGVTANPVKLTRSVRQALTHVTCGGAPTYLWPGGGITVMSDVTQMPTNAFGYVPTPALVAPIEFTVSREDYEAMGGHMGHIMPLADALDGATGEQNDHVMSGQRTVAQTKDGQWPLAGKSHR